MLLCHLKSHSTALNDLAYLEMLWNNLTSIRVLHTPRTGQNLFFFLQDFTHFSKFCMLQIYLINFSEFTSTSSKVVYFDQLLDSILYQRLYILTSSSVLLILYLISYHDSIKFLQKAKNCKRADFILCLECTAPNAGQNIKKLYLLYPFSKSPLLLLLKVPYFLRAGC